VEKDYEDIDEIGPDATPNVMSDDQ